jgi:hypothetical protein
MGNRPDLQFLATGLLSTTPLVRQVTLAELREYFVERFPGSETRARLYDNFVHYLKLLAVFVELRGVIVNGSFVTSKPDPRDIDISPVIDGIAFDKLPRDQQDTVFFLADHNTRVAQLLRCHTVHTVFYYPQGHNSRLKTEQVFEKSKKLWSRARGGRQKGFLYLQTDKTMGWR